MSIHKLPLGILGMEDIPAVPVELSGLVKTLVNLGLRTEEFKQATYGLSNVYTIRGITAPAYPFLFGESDTDSDSASEDEKSGCLSTVSGLVKKALGGSDSAGSTTTTKPHRADRSAAARAKLQGMLESHPSEAMMDFINQKMAEPGHQPLVPIEPPEVTGLSLDDPKQFSMTWTTYWNVYRDALPHLDEWASTLTDPDEASRQFWPLIANHGLGYNLLFLKKLSVLNMDEYKGRFGDTWGAGLDAAVEQGLLYVIDLSIFETLEPQEADGFQRFTPATLTLLRQDPETKALTPVAVRVSGHQGRGAQIFVRGEATDGTWIYALQAARVSVTVYGIWLGHVYHWHIVLAAMQMTMFNNLSEDHPLYQLLAPQSQYLIDFDVVLLLLWEHIAPSTSIISSRQFLELMNTFAKGRDYFDDDPNTALENLGLRQEDFTVDQPWDRYPLVGQLLTVWHATGDYVKVFVDQTYADDAAIVADQALQDWIKQSSERDHGNIRGLPNMDNREALIRVLQSMLFRVTVHGCSRLGPAINPVISFGGIYPPTFQGSEIPAPSAHFDTAMLMKLMPKTGVLGQMVIFYFIFLYTPPYETFVPIDGIEENLFFPGGRSDPRNRALVAFRKAIIDFMTDFEDGSPQINQWPLNIET